MVVKPADTGILIINGIGVKNILRGNNGIYNTDCKIVNDDAFNIVTIKLIDPNNELNPAICGLENNKSILDELIIDNGI